MKIVLFFSCLSLLLGTTGCLVRDGRGHGHYRGREHYEGRSEVVAGPPVLVVRPAEVILR